MPSKKIATAIRSANRATVNNYNAANRAVNRAPAWVKWTVGIVAVAVILYVLWKVLFAERKEGFGTRQDWNGKPWRVAFNSKKMNTAGLDKFNINNDITANMYGNANNVIEMEKSSAVGKHGMYYSMPLAYPVATAARDCDNNSNCHGFEFIIPKREVRFFGKGADVVTETDWAQYLEDAANHQIWLKGEAQKPGVKSFNITDIQTAGTKFDNINFVGRNAGGSIVVGGTHGFGPVSDVNACMRAVKEKNTDMVYKKSTGECTGKYIRTGDIGKQGGEGIEAVDDTDYISISWDDSWNTYNQIPSSSRFYLFTNFNGNNIYYHSKENKVNAVDSAPAIESEWFEYHYRKDVFSHIKSGGNSQWLVQRSNNQWLEFTDKASESRDFTIENVKGSNKFIIKTNTSSGTMYIHPWGTVGIGGLKLGTTPYEWDIVWKQI